MGHSLLNQPTSQPTRSTPGHPSTLMRLEWEVRQEGEGEGAREGVGEGGEGGGRRGGHSINDDIKL